MSESTAELFHPLVWRWFEGRFGAPTEPQAEGWPLIASGRDTLIAAPTGSGKTLAAFLWSIDHLTKVALDGSLQDRTYVLYVSPLKALGNDIHRNLQEPLRGIRELAQSTGLGKLDIRVAVRTGDTPASERRAMLKRPPHILITTPESLYILLTAEGSRGYLATAETVIVDEIHAVAGDKRGAHLTLTLERLDRLAGRKLQRVGLSATQKPMIDIARLLVGAGRETADGDPDCAILDRGHNRRLDLSIEVPDQPLGPIASHDLWAEIYDRIVAHAKEQRTTLVYVNTRRLAERVAFQLSHRIGPDKVAAHHGSLSRSARLKAEAGLKSGEVPLVVATASLELGIDIGHIDLVCHIGAPRSLASLLQRVGRSAHRPPGSAVTEIAVPRGILFPLTRDELVQAAAAVRAIRQRELDRVIMPQAPLDILAQHMVAIAASEEIGVEELLELVRRSHAYRNLSREDFEAALELVAEGVSTRRGRRSAYVQHDRVNGRLKGRRGARLAAITSGGAIPDTADYDVLLEPDGRLVGKVNEDFAVESMAGDIFLLGTQSWRIRRIGSGQVRVEDAQGAPPNIPFWLGEAPARTAELSAAVAELRSQVRSRLGDLPAAVAWLQAECGLDQAGAEQLLAYVSETVAALGEVPSQRTVIAERFFDEAGGMQLVVHAPFGGRINRAWGLAMRKRFCVTFDFELQAAATDDGFVLSLGEQHSFPLQDVFELVRGANLQDALEQATLTAPMFANRWRWNASRSLALPRFSGGRRVPMPLQRMRAEDLLAAVFPDQVACQDNRAGPVQIPDHPLVQQTMHDCLHEAMDLEGLRRVLADIESGAIEVQAVDTVAPSPASHEILNANPYAFLDDAPLEERRARAVSLRRTDPDLARGIGALDSQVLQEVRAQAWPEVRDEDELHDALLQLTLVPEEELGAWREYLPGLLQAERAAWVSWEAAVGVSQAGTKSGGRDAGGAGALRRGVVAAERIPRLLQVIPAARIEPALEVPPLGPSETQLLEQVRGATAMVQGWMECIGPAAAESLAERLGLTAADVQAALLQLEAEGQVLRGQFTAAARELEWCDRRLLARMHRLTIGKLRREIQSVPAADLIRFLLHWQWVQPGAQLSGPEGLLRVIRQLQGLELPAPAWEREILPVRLSDYKPSDLEALCLAGQVVWGRLSGRETPTDGQPGDSAATSQIAEPAGLAARQLLEAGEMDPEAGEIHPESGGRRRPRRLAAPTRSAPIGFALREDLPTLLEPWEQRSGVRDNLSGPARQVLAYLESQGASFLEDIRRGTGQLPGQAQDALWELAASGLVTADGLADLRALLLPASQRDQIRRQRSRKGGALPLTVGPRGRWALLGRNAGQSAPQEHGERQPAGSGAARSGALPDPHARVESFARQLLLRYGVVLRELLAREPQAPPWRELVRVYRTLEARGEIRGGRFVDGLIGEQYALPEAVDLLRRVRRTPDAVEQVAVSAADPLNLVGILTPGKRVSPLSGLYILYERGVPIAIDELGPLRRRAVPLGAPASAP
jgi:ATP-dependent Lhr-like helicase